MVAPIARREILDILRDRRFHLTAVLLLSLLAAALAAGWSGFRQMRAEQEAAQRLTREQWENLPARNPHGAAHYGIFALRPAAPLSLLDPGLDPFLGRAIYQEAHFQNPARYRAAEDATALARMADLSAAGILRLLVPLAILLLAHAVFAGERERGTLRQVLSLGVRHRDLVLGKALGVAAALGAFLVPAVLLGLLVFRLSPAGQEVSVPGLALIAVGYLAYHLGFLGLALAVSAVARTASSALAILLGFWACNGFLVPVLASDLAERLHPIPTAVEFAEGVHHDLEHGLDGHRPDSPFMKELEARLLAQYRVATREELPVNFWGVVWLESEKVSDAVMDRHYAALWERYRRQERIERAAAVAAPSIALRSWSMGLAGTGLPAYRDFLTRAEEYRRQFNRRLNENLRDNSRGTESYMADPSFWKTLPELVLHPPGTRESVAGQAWSLGVLLLWAVLAPAAALFAASRFLRV